MFSGMFELPSWGYAIAALVLTHATIVAVTVFLHRHQTHRALELHPAASHAFRLWLWLTTGMVTKQWVAVHRKHHAKCETTLDPHSPRILGINRVLWAGVFLYVKEANQADTLERYGAGTPNDWVERNVYSRWPFLGVTLMGVVDVTLFGVVPGALIFLAQMVWIPFWAAGVIFGAVALLISLVCGLMGRHSREGRIALAGFWVVLFLWAGFRAGPSSAAPDVLRATGLPTGTTTPVADREAKERPGLPGKPSTRAKSMVRAQSGVLAQLSRYQP